MDLLQSLLSGWYDVTIIALGCFVLLAHLGLLAAWPSISWVSHRAWQRLLGNSIHLFPLLGIMGTVVGLIKTMRFIALEGASNMERVVDHFAIALTSTLWGILFAFILTLINLVYEYRVGDEP